MIDEKVVHPPRTPVPRNRRRVTASGRAVNSEPPMTRFIAAELAKDHWFDLSAARRDLGYAPRVTMAAGTAELVAHLRGSACRS